MQFLLIVSSSILEDRAPIYEIIGSVTTICACGGEMSRRHFWGRMPPNDDVYRRRMHHLAERFVWEGTVPVDGARVCRALRHPSPRDTHAVDVRTITEGDVLWVRQGGRGADFGHANPPIESVGIPPYGGLAIVSSSLYGLSGPCRRDRHGAPGRKGRSLVYRSRHWWDAVERNNELIEEVLAGINAKRAGVRFGSSKALRILSERVPEALYPHFDSFAAMLSHDNQILKWNATLTLANMARVDREGKIEAILDQYLDLITGPNMITAANAIRGAAIIGVAKPHLVRRIVLCILRVERAEYATPECWNVVIGHALQALELLAGLLPDQRVLRLFASRHVANPRPATSSKARKFLKARKKTA